MNRPGLCARYQTTVGEVCPVDESFAQEPESVALGNTLQFTARWPDELRTAGCCEHGFCDNFRETRIGCRIVIQSTVRLDVTNLRTLLLSDVL